LDRLSLLARFGVLKIVSEPPVTQCNQQPARD
jgi:hypothetical protein